MVLPMTVQTLPLDGPRLYSAPKEMLIDLSVVIPVHNEEDNAVPLYNEVRKEREFGPHDRAAGRGLCG